MGFTNILKAETQWSVLRLSFSSRLIMPLDTPAIKLLTYSCSSNLYHSKPTYFLLPWVFDRKEYIRTRHFIFEVPLQCSRFVQDSCDTVKFIQISLERKYKVLFNVWIDYFAETFARICNTNKPKLSLKLPYDMQCLSLNN